MRRRSSRRKLESAFEAKTNQMTNHTRDDVVMKGELYLKVTKKKGISWKLCELVLKKDGKLQVSDEKFALMSITQQTKVFNSEFREHCFVICTPSEKKVTVACSSEEEKGEWKEKLELCAKLSPAHQVKIVLVGDNKSLQQKLLHNFFSECGQKELAEDILDYAYKSSNVEITVEVTGVKVRLMLCCVGSDDFKSLRVLNYVDANAFMICFNSSELSEFENIEKVWFPEVQSSVSKGASLFLIGTRDKKEESEEKELIDGVIGEELANFLNGMFFSCDLNLTSEDIKKRQRKDSMESESVGDGSQVVEFESPAETFLDILQNTIEDSRGEYIEDGESADTDVANMNDFSKDYFGSSAKKMNFMQFVKKRTQGMKRMVSRKTMLPSRKHKPKVSSRNSMNLNDASSSFTNKKLSLGVIVRLQMMLKNLKPKPKIKKERPVIDEEALRNAHFVSRQQTGSLIFLGERFLDLDIDNEKDEEKVSTHTLE